MSVKIFVACHNKLPIVSGDLLTTIQLGKSNSLLNLCECNDETGDNISKLNSSFCELTGLYWIWKNASVLDYVGLYHYRRYFASPSMKNRFVDKIIKFKVWLNGGGFDYYYPSGEILANLDQFTNLVLQGFDIMIPKKYNLGRSVRIDYAHHHLYSDWEQLRAIVYQFYEVDVKYFDEVSKRNYLHPFNMFIMKQMYFHAYCEWVFPVLFEYDRLKTFEQDPYQQRVIGFLAERLFNIFLLKLQTEKPSLKFCELYVIKVE